MAGVSVTIEDRDGVIRGVGPLASVTRWSHTARLDRAGSVTFDLPATDPRAELITLRSYARCFGLRDAARAELGMGIVDRVELLTDQRTIRASGDDLLRELAWLSMGFEPFWVEGGGTLNPISITDALDKLLDVINTQAANDWTIDATTYAPDTPITPDEIFYAFAGESVLAGLNKIAAATGCHWRLGVGREIVWVWRTVEASGVRAVIGADAVAAESNTDICLITDLSHLNDTTELISTIVPWGSGTGSTRLSLDGTDRTVPDGYTYDDEANMITRIDAEVAYGTSVRHVTFQDITVGLDEDDPGYADALLAAKNQLWDAALEYLRLHSAPDEAFRLDVTKLDRAVLPGQSIRVIYSGWVDGYQWVDIDRDLLVLEATTTIDGRGVQTPTLVVSASDRWPMTDEELLVSLLRDVQQGQRHDQSVAHAETVAGLAIADGDTLTVPDSGTAALVETSPRLLNADVSATIVSNTVVETTVYSYSVPGGTLGTQNRIDLLLVGSLTNNTGANQAFRLRVKYGATTIVDVNIASLAASATPRPFVLTCHLMAAGATNAQVPGASFHLGGATGIGGVVGQVGGVYPAVHATVAEDSTANKTLEATVTFATASANLSASVYVAHTEIIR